MNRRSFLKLGLSSLILPISLKLNAGSKQIVKIDQFVMIDKPLHIYAGDELVIKRCNVRFSESGYIHIHPGAKYEITNNIFESSPSWHSKAQIVLSV